MSATKEMNGRYPWCPDCEGRGQLPCTVCRGGHADCERCEGTDSEVCTTCEQMHTLFKGEPMTNILAMARELVTLRAEKAKPRLITVSSGGTYLSSEDVNAALCRLELKHAKARAKARAKAALLKDCGQAGVCILSPGCVRHFLERNVELVKERDRARAEAKENKTLYEKGQGHYYFLLDEMKKYMEAGDEARAKAAQLEKLNAELSQALAKDYATALPLQREAASESTP